MPTESRHHRCPADYSVPIRRMYDKNGVRGDKECWECQWLVYGEVDRRWKRYCLLYEGKGKALNRGCVLNYRGVPWDSQWTACGAFTSINGEDQ